MRPCTAEDRLCIADVQRLGVMSRRIHTSRRRFATQTATAVTPGNKMSVIARAAALATLPS